MVSRELQITGDGSHTVYWREYRQHYHNKKGALEESIHIFLREGLDKVCSEGVTEVFEMGFGTGLNPLLTLVDAEVNQRHIRFTSLEAYPLVEEEYLPLNYGEMLPHPQAGEWLRAMHEAPWETWVRLTPHFELRKVQAELSAWVPDQRFHVIFFDAFAPSTQPELWTESIFSKMLEMLHPGGAITTYCAKGSMKRAMRAAGFEVESPPGALGRREMTRGWKR
jgi:tRNA U34 5-methylaminomethyl-2-thiouridine-forming methyltransferase MnmC